MGKNDPWLDWAVELQSLAQAGLYYTRDIYDAQRFERIRTIAAEILSHRSGLPVDTVKDLFCGETGYQTPKIDTRAAVIREDKILLVREQSGLWALPGGWCDVNVSVKENTLKELREEAGLEAVAERVVAIVDRDRYHPRTHPFKICQVFVLCRALGGAFRENAETTASGWFSREALPPLAPEKSNEGHIRMCFEAHRAEHWETVVD